MINLNHIGSLAAVAKANYINLAENHIYNAASNSGQVTTQPFVTLLKMHLQAQNLLTKLRRVHKTCTDFVTGNFDSYIDAHNWHEAKQSEEFRSPYEPINELHHCFSGMMADGLPTRIEQYSELVSLARSFADHCKTLRPYQFELVDSTGYVDIVSEEDLSDETRLRLVSERESQNVEVQFCLDQYNTFYELATGLLIEDTSEDVQSIAQSMLTFFESPSSHLI